MKGLMCGCPNIWVGAQPQAMMQGCAKKGSPLSYRGSDLTRGKFLETETPVYKPCINYFVSQPDINNLPSTFRSLSETFVRIRSLFSSFSGSCHGSDVMFSETPVVSHSDSRTVVKSKLKTFRLFGLVYLTKSEINCVSAN